MFGSLNSEGPDPEKPPPAAIIAIPTLTQYCHNPESNRSLLFEDIFQVTKSNIMNIYCYVVRLLVIKKSHMRVINS